MQTRGSASARRTRPNLSRPGDAARASEDRDDAGGRGTYRRGYWPGRLGPQCSSVLDASSLLISYYKISTKYIDIFKGWGARRSGPFTATAGPNRSPDAIDRAGRAPARRGGQRPPPAQAAFEISLTTRRAAPARQTRRHLARGGRLGLRAPRWRGFSPGDSACAPCTLAGPGQRDETRRRSWTSDDTATR